jgi:hypothetical protein
VSECTTRKEESKWIKYLKKAEKKYFFERERDCEGLVEGT